MQTDKIALSAVANNTCQQHAKALLVAAVQYFSTAAMPITPPARLKSEAAELHDALQKLAAAAGGCVDCHGLLARFGLCPALAGSFWRTWPRTTHCDTKQPNRVTVTGD